MNNQKKENKLVKYILIGICVLFLFVMLVLPLCYIISIALGSGIKTYLAAITDKYTLKAMKLTIIATLWALGVNMFFGLSAAWCLTRFDFIVLVTVLLFPIKIFPKCALVNILN